ncbi:MAG: YitT family protein [Oscillospiraceae bacterium]
MRSRPRGAGINGLCTMVQYALGIRVSVLNLLVNIPLALLVFKLVSRPLAIRSLAYTLAFSLALAILERVPLEQFAYATENGTSTILGPVVAGIINGFCYSVVMRGGSYTGGLDYVAALIHVKAPGYFLTLTFCPQLRGSRFRTSFTAEIRPGHSVCILCVASSAATSQTASCAAKKAAIKFEIVAAAGCFPGRSTATWGFGAQPTSGQRHVLRRGHILLLCIINKRQILG